MRKGSPQKADYDMYANEALFQAKIDIGGGMNFVFTVTTELMPPHPEECTLNANDDIICVVRDLLILL
jgi:hypothetical protein